MSATGRIGTKRRRFQTQRCRGSIDEEEWILRNICVVGAGYVGLVTGTCFADLGNRVTALDLNEERIKNLNAGILPIYEPGLEEVVRRNVAAGRLRFTTSYDEALTDAEFAFIAVGTPEGVDGEADLQYVRSAAEAVADHMTGPLVIVNKSGNIEVRFVRTSGLVMHTICARNLDDSISSFTPVPGHFELIITNHENGAINLWDIEKGACACE